jgi:hypothetical protein
MFMALAEATLCKQLANKKSTREREYTFKAHFGMSEEAAIKTWSLLETHVIELRTMKPRTIHFLWTLFFLKCYHTEETAVSLAECSRKTYRLWVWETIDCLNDLKDVVVSLIDYCA